jgi:glycosyltransferase involved in cell wall biosynthesis
MRICFFPRVGSGGPASFQFRLAEAFAQSGIEVTYSLDARPLDAVLVFSATRRWDALARCRKEGIRIVQRLDGIHWLHYQPPIRPVYFVRAEMRNWMQRLIRRLYTDRIIYQSQFVRSWWERWYGRASAPAQTILNGIRLPDYPARVGGHDGTLLVVEGNLHHNPPTVHLLREANRLLVKEGPFLRMSILGRLDSPWGAEWPRFDPRPETTGLIPRAEVKRRQQSAAAFLSAEINPPCPNAVIEAMAAGVPVIGLDTGALREMLGDHGVLATYGGDPWTQETPSGMEALTEGARAMMRNWEGHSHRARIEAERRFNISSVAAAYQEVLVG